ncbi:MAG: M28 family peptidase [Steroidobacteraceae bacterium]
MPAHLLPASLLLLVSLSASGLEPAPSDLEEARELMERATTEGTAYDHVASLTTEVGPRPAGSDGDKAAVAWAERRFRSLGIEEVRLQPVQVPHWVRGTIETRVTAPFPQPLVAAALGGSIGTPEQGLEGEVVAFPTLEALRAASREQVEGRIVYIGQPARRDATWAGYGEAVAKRVAGPSVASGLGARALLIRSVGTSPSRLPHTGTLSYSVNAPKIPAAALSNPDADLLERMLAGGEAVTVFLKMTSRDLPYETSANVIAELPGSDLAEEIVLIGAHLDSWDLGTGAIDDGAGVAIVMEVAARLAALGKPLRRTLRVVLFASEEYTLAGATAYSRLPEDELDRHVLAMEADAGAGAAVRLQSLLPEAQVGFADTVTELLKPLGIERGGNAAGGGPDIRPLVARGIPVLTIEQDVSAYLDAHHSPDDNLDKVDRVTLERVTAAYLATVYLALQAEGEFGRMPERRP